MKKLVVILGIFALLFNTLAGLLFPSYEPFYYLLADVSIALTTAFLSILVYSRIDDGLKIGLTAFFIITGTVRFLLFLFLPRQLENNGVLIGIVGIILLETACLTIPFLLKKS